MTQVLSLETTWQSHWLPEFIGTLLFVVQNGQVLLIHKKTGHGAGRINGPGGKLEPGESVVSCAVRETREEVGIEVSSARCVLEMRFVERDGPQWLGFACIAENFSGDLRETDEANPFWCPLSDIPYERMWPDDAIWLPYILHTNIRAPRVADFLFRRGELLDHAWRDVPSVVNRF